MMIDNKIPRLYPVGRVVIERTSKLSWRIIGYTGGGKLICNPLDWIAQKYNAGEETKLLDPAEIILQPQLTR